jgi:hypothetical protein
MGFFYKANSRREGRKIQSKTLVRGYSQTYGIDYDETFTPVAKMSTVRTLISSRGGIYGDSSRIFHA